jgi:hypothetical protein
MFDWNAELEVAKHRVAELEDMVARMKDALQQRADGDAAATPIERIPGVAQSALAVRMASLDRARYHQHFIEHKIAMGATKPTPYLELAEACFKAAQWMPPGEAAETMRRSGATFYTKAIAEEKTSPSDAQAKAIFQDMAASWARSPTSPR